MTEVARCPICDAREAMAGEDAEIVYFAAMCAVAAFGFERVHGAMCADHRAALAKATERWKDISVVHATRGGDA